MGLTFENSRVRFNRNRYSVTFTADCGAKIIECDITVQALESHFGMTGDAAQNAVAVFKQNRSVIERAAAAKYTDGNVVLVSSDFRGSGKGIPIPD